MTSKMYQCGHCQKIYAWPSDLNRHVKHKHSATAAPAAAPAAAAAGPKLSAKSMLFHHPFTMTISGLIGSGKTYFVKSMLAQCKISPNPDRIGLFMQTLATIVGVHKRNCSQYRFFLRHTRHTWRRCLL